MSRQQGLKILGIIATLIIILMSIKFGYCKDSCINDAFINNNLANKNERKSLNSEVEETLTASSEKNHDEQDESLQVFNGTKGQFARVNEWTYYPVHNYDEYGLYKRNNDTEKILKVSDDFIEYLYSDENWFYFTALDNPKYESYEEGYIGDYVLYRMRHDGSEKTLLYNGWNHLFGVIDDDVYFLGENNNQYSIYRIQSTGQSLDELISGVYPHPLPQIYQSSIYFQRYEDDYKMCKYTVDKKIIELFSSANVLSKGYIENFVVSNEAIYFSISDIGESFLAYEGIYAYNFLDQSFKQLISVNAAGGLTLTNKNKLYYTTVRANGDINDLTTYYLSYYVNRLDIKSKLSERLFEIDNDYLGAIDSKVYCYKNGNVFYYDE